jgi:type I restriction-modification system DNA methylase subunit
MPPASSRNEGLEQLQALVGRFSANEQHYRSVDFDETATREQFINPFFQALGWDVLDEGGLGPRREVVSHRRLVDDPQFTGLDEWDEDLSAEELAERAPVARIPDYSFQIDSATRFFVEAKAARVTLDRRAPAFQVKSYAWSQHVPLAVLSSFAELAVFVGSARPDYEQPNAGLVRGLRLSYRDYETNWEQLWDQLSREAVEAGSSERLAIDERPRGALRVDEAFLEELSGWRQELAHDLYTHNRNLDQWELGEATQRILDRLTFIRVCEDRRVEPTVVLRRFARRTDAYRQLRTEFRRLDEVYNGNLFAEHFSERLEASDGVLQRIIERLYPPFSPYRFDVVGTDLLGAVYERFLGREITIQGGEVALEEKPEVRHAGGVYYTPRWVVDEIVASTLGPMLDGRTPRTAEGLRIVDPACGSGSFLLGALDYLVRWHEDYYTEHPTEHADRHYSGADDRERLTSDAKADLVVKNLFGVDIDPQAVEVAQMSLYLRILEGETDSTLHQRPRLFHGPFLPPLNRNLRSGNSLLKPLDVPTQLLFDDELRRRVNPFDWEDPDEGFGAVFDERHGFDVVIGNPPYTRAQVLRVTRPEETAIYNTIYKSGRGSFDIAAIFVERGLQLLRPQRGNDQGGRLGFIVSRTFTETDSAEPLRRILADGGHLQEVVDFRDGLVFEGVSAYTLLLRASQRSNGRFRLTRVPPPPTAAGLRSARTGASPLTAEIDPTSLGDEPWSLSLPPESALLEKLDQAGPRLLEVTGGHVFQGPITGADYVFRARDAGQDPNDPTIQLVLPHVLEAEAAPIAVERALLRPVLAGRTAIQRFRFTPGADWLIFPYERDSPDQDYRLISATAMSERYPATHAWLGRNEEALRDRSSGTWNDENWVGYSRRQNLELFDGPKILVPYMSDQLCAVYDPGRYFFVNVATGGYGLTVDEAFSVEPGYLAALLSGDLLAWAIGRYARAFRGGYAGARAGTLARLPVASPSPEEQRRVVEAEATCRQAATALGDAVSDSDREALRRVYETTVRTFDGMVAGLYDVTPEDLASIAALR